MEGPIADGTLRTEALKAIAGVKWDPAWGEERIANMVATRPTGASLVSVSGSAIAVFFCDACGKLHESPATNRAVIDLFAREGADAGTLVPPLRSFPRNTCATAATAASVKKWTSSMSGSSRLIPGLRPAQNLRALAAADMTSRAAISIADGLHFPCLLYRPERRITLQGCRHQWLDPR